MNVLIFVVTMVMLLSLMTYSRLDSYRNSQTYQVIFKHFMEKDERGYINVRGRKTYEDIKVKEGEENGDGKKKSKKVDASPSISIALLLDPKREEKTKEWEQTKILLASLMKTLYSNQPFYIELEKEHPGFVNDLIRDLTQTIDALPKETKPKIPQDLGNLRLSDPKLDAALYKMLKGALKLNVVTDEQKNEKATEVIVETSVDDNEISNKTDEYQSPEGYYSLLDYLTDKPSKQVRVYLAPLNVLLSIFSKDSVNDIIAVREQLYKQAMAGSDTDQLSESFKNQFLKLKDAAIDDDTLNFTVNKTNPKKYR
jgi:hypothetical protein